MQAVFKFNILCWQKRISCIVPLVLFHGQNDIVLDYYYFFPKKPNRYFVSERSSHRLEDLNWQLDPLVEQVNSIKGKELLYRKAFTRRCYDLQTAEAEVRTFCLSV